MEKPDNCDHLAVWQEISPFLCHVKMGQFSFVPIPIFFALLHARLKCLGLQRWMEGEWQNLRRLWPQYGLIVWRRCNRLESFIPSFFFIAKENHDYLKHVLLVIYCVRIKLQGIPQVTFAQSHPMPRWVLLFGRWVLPLSLNCSLAPFDLCSEPPNVKVGGLSFAKYFSNL